MYVCMYCVVSVQVIQLGVDEGVEMIKLNLKRPCGLNGYFSFVSSFFFFFFFLFEVEL